MSESPAYTARNSNRWTSRDHWPADKYLATEIIHVEPGEQEAIRKARALRVANRIVQQARHCVTRSVTESGLARIFSSLHGVRDAENFNALIFRDRYTAGMIDSAFNFQTISLADFDRLRTLRENAFEHRKQELLP